MNATAPKAFASLPDMGEQRFACVEREHSWLRTPLNWKLRLWGPSVGGYGTLNGATSKYSTEAAAELAAAVWMDTGVTPAFQTDAMRSAAREANGEFQS